MLKIKLRDVFQKLSTAFFTPRAGQDVVTKICSLERTFKIYIAGQQQLSKTKRKNYN